MKQCPLHMHVEHTIPELILPCCYNNHHYYGKAFARYWNVFWNGYLCSISHKHIDKVRYWSWVRMSDVQLPLQLFSGVEVRTAQTTWFLPNLAKPVEMDLGYYHTRTGLFWAPRCTRGEIYLTNVTVVYNNTALLFIWPAWKTLAQTRSAKLEHVTITLSLVWCMEIKCYEVNFLIHWRIFVLPVLWQQFREESHIAMMSRYDWRQFIQRATINCDYSLNDFQTLIAFFDSIQ